MDEIVPLRAKKQTRNFAIEKPVSTFSFLLSLSFFFFFFFCFFLCITWFKTFDHRGVKRINDDTLIFLRKKSQKDNGDGISSFYLWCILSPSINYF